MANISKEERQRRETVAKEREDAETLDNPREPIAPVRDDAPDPTTPAATALPTGTPGMPEPTELDDPVKQAESRRDADAVIPMRKVRLKRGYFTESGGEKLEAGTELELPIADARYLVESGIADVLVDL